MAWNILEAGAREGLRVLTQLVLARLLVPEHFGLVGMAVVFTGLVNLIADLGLGQALIQKARSELTRLHINSMFWGATAFAVLLYPLTALGLGKAASWFFDEPLVYPLIAVLAIGVIFRPFYMIARSMLLKEYRYKPIVLADVGAVLLAASMAVIAAWSGAGLWSIVILLLGQSLAVLPLIWVASGWRPGLEFSWPAFSEMAGFGSYVTLNNLFSYALKNIDYLIIGKLLGASSLGIYTLAFLITDIARSKIKQIFDVVYYPVYCAEQDDIRQVLGLYLQTVRLLAMVVFPLMMLLVLFADRGVPAVLGEQWSEAAGPMKILAVACMVHAIGGTSGMVIRALGRPEVNLRINVINSLIIGIPAIVVGARYWGMMGVAGAILLIKITSRLMWQWCLRSLVGCKESHVAIALAPAFAGVFILTVVAVLSAWVMQPFRGAAIVEAGVACVAYIAVVGMICRRELREMTAQIRMRRA